MIRGEANELTVLFIEVVLDMYEIGNSLKHC